MRLTELLEFLKNLEKRGEPASLPKLANEFKCSVEEAKAMVDEAVKKGLVKVSNGGIKLTAEGLTEIVKHREDYLHGRYGHRGLLGGLSKLLEGRVNDWRFHWRHKHGLDENSLNAFYESLRELEGYVEDVVPLTFLKEGERGIVVHAIGGRGIVKRLSEMGLTPGVEVAVKRSAPFYGPIQITVRGVSLALGRGIASKIFIKRAPNEGS